MEKCQELVSGVAEEAFWGGVSDDGDVVREGDEECLFVENVSGT